MRGKNRPPPQSYRSCNQELRSGLVLMNVLIKGPSSHQHCTSVPSSGSVDWIYSVDITHTKIDLGHFVLRKTVGNNIVDVGSLLCLWMCVTIPIDLTPYEYVFLSYVFTFNDSMITQFVVPMLGSLQLTFFVLYFLVYDKVRSK